MKICLQNEYCINISVGRVYRLMKSMSLPKMSTQKPFIHKSKSASDENLENRLCQRFNQPEPNLVWVCDFTYIRVAGKFFYLCAIIDLFSRKVIAYKLSNKIDTQLAINTVNMAVANRGKSKVVIFHTDRGSQFTSFEFRKHLDSLDMIQSFSAKAHPYDNAVMECFFKYLKKEETNRKSYSSFYELNISLFEYINGFYNSVRPHSHNDGLSPMISFVSSIVETEVEEIVSDGKVSKAPAETKLESNIVKLQIIAKVFFNAFFIISFLSYEIFKVYIKSITSDTFLL